MRKFFFRPQDRSGDIVSLSEGESHHIRSVLRLHAGRHVELFDGDGGIHRAELIEMGERVRARIVSSAYGDAPLSVPLRVGQGLLKGKTMDVVVQKCTELGVQGLAPLLTSRCQGRPEADRDRKKHQRWLRIVEEACKQCGRARPMELSETEAFRDFIRSPAAEAAGLKLLFWEEEHEVCLRDLLPLDAAAGVCILLGPEGGFSAEEVAAAREAGWRTVSLGRRILRAETATLAAAAILQHLLGAM
ncbi:MAG: 16S rRNA (uracil(1498)-N(3))-methyltransferase [Desulfocapsaceae bacterium]|nr:16S rRNA (uracil(1498)-N(3))-methyltransferase [Desulfocapsaceae bacterium]